MSTVLLVRHGRTTSNASGTLAGWTPGVDLDDVGRAQASALAQRLSGVALAAVVTSPLDRTRQTAELLIAGRKPPVELDIDENVGECRYGDWTGKPRKELAKTPEWKAVQAHPSAVTFPGDAGESMASMAHRAVAAVRSWNATLGPDATYAIVSHGDVIKAILADALGLHLDLFQRVQVDPGSLSVIRYSPLRPFVERMNDTGGSVAGLTPPKRRSRGKTKGRSSEAVVGGGAGT